MELKVWSARGHSSVAAEVITFMRLLGCSVEPAARQRSNADARLAVRNVSRSSGGLPQDWAVTLTGLQRTMIDRGRGIRAQ